jgi:hypothetical protein
METLTTKEKGQWLAVLGGWILFVWFWLRVAGETSPGTILWGVAAVGAITALVTTTTVWWIVHNLRIHKRKGPRRSVPIAMPVYRQDFLGRDLDGDWSLLRRSSVVVVLAEDGRKRFALGFERPAGP